MKALLSPDFWQAFFTIAGIVVPASTGGHKVLPYIVEIALSIGATSLSFFVFIVLPYFCNQNRHIVEYRILSS